MFVHWVLLFLLFACWLLLIVMAVLFGYFPKCNNFCFLQKFCFSIRSNPCYFLLSFFLSADLNSRIDHDRSGSIEKVKKLMPTYISVGLYDHTLCSYVGYRFFFHYAPANSLINHHLKRQCAACYKDMCIRFTLGDTTDNELTPLSTRSY